MIAIHVCSKGYEYSHTTKWYVYCSVDSVVRWGVPIFVMVSGALFLGVKQIMSIELLYKKYISRLAIVFVIWWIIYNVYDILTQGENFHLSIKYHLWFLPMLIGVYAIIPLLRKMISEKQMLEYFLVLWFVFSVYYFIPKINVLPIEMCYCCGYSGYFVLGYYLYQVKPKRKHLIFVHLLGIISAIFSVLGNIIYSEYKGYTTYLFLNNFSPFVIFMSVSIFLFVREKESFFSGKIVKLFKGDLLGIYLIHALWVEILYNNFFSRWTTSLVIPIMIVLVFVLSWGSTKLLKTIPLIKKIVM